MKIWIGLGSNLGDSEALVGSALTELDKHPQFQLLRCSSFYRTTPWGLPDQPQFINAVAEFNTGLGAPQALKVLLDIETALGRTRTGPRWGPRKIDIDLLLYGDYIYVMPGLRIPHPRMHLRRFVLEPLAELQPDLLIPGRGTVFSCLERVGRESPGKANYELE